MPTEVPRATAATRCPGSATVPGVTQDLGPSPVENERGLTHASLGAGEVTRGSQRRVLMTTCQAHGAAGFTNLLVTKGGRVHRPEPTPGELLRAATR